ncbi:DUF6764 family protein [Rhodococcus sp. CH91]|uniref:DUF6764 family protein n=1 Tax=Rhodococcus sp. CH91 TaxID=2910256 RepID=UPI001F4BCAE7|nr:DUF6764 family protein [Rhodococcus sp. CH91]
MFRSWTSDRILGAGVALAAAVGAGFLVPQSASAATTCSAPPGAAAEVVQVGDEEACGATTDGTAEAWGYGERGVGFADGRAGALVGAAGLDGGVGAAESTSGRLFALGVGAQALALGVLEGPGTAFVVAGPQSQAFVGDADDPVLCQGSGAAAFDLETVRGCIVVGDFRYVTLGAQTPPTDLP